MGIGSEFGGLGIGFRFAGDWGAAARTVRPAETDQSGSSQPGGRCEIPAAEFANRSYRMTRGDGSVVVHSLFLLADGRLFGSPSVNELFWTVTGDGVVFLDRQREVTTRFTDITRNEFGWRLEGDFQDGKQRHILEEYEKAGDPAHLDRGPVGDWSRSWCGPTSSTIGCGS